MGEEVRRALEALRDPVVAAHSQRFFKTGPGEYGEGDRFLGVRVPQLRALARAHRSLPLDAVVGHLRSTWHEERLLALLILVEQHRRGSFEVRERMHRAYLEHTRFVNNWDLVDTSAEHVVGPHVDPGGYVVIQFSLGLVHRSRILEREAPRSYAGVDLRNHDAGRSWDRGYADS